MREILFRGKNVIGGPWLNGDLIHTTNGKAPMIRTHSKNSGISYMVIPDTVGQYTGLKDKNGKRIFEGDILSFPDTGEEGYEYKEGYAFTNVATVCWNNGRWELEDYGDYNSGVMDDMEVSCHYDFITTFRIGEVIGNIHDNPELIAEVEGCE